MHQRRPRFPSDVRQLLEPKLQRHLQDCVGRNGGRCLLAFVNGEQFEVPPALKTDPEWNIILKSVGEGLIGQALGSEKVQTWKLGDAASPMIRGDERTIQEFALAVSYRGHHVAVLLIDFFEGENPNLRPYMVQAWGREIERLLESADEDHLKLASDFEASAEEVVALTGSLRGFVAIIRWDGTPKYFAAGADIGKFRYLNQLEGVCGEALGTRRFVNLPDVRKSRAYRASDPEVRSEAVAPILVDGEAVGVLNMESEALGHYGADAQAEMERAAASLADLARQYRVPPGGGISLHSRLLSDLVEKFSIDNSALIALLEERDVRSWACELCQAKVMALEGVQAARFLDLDDEGRPSTGHGRRYRQAINPQTSVKIVDGEDGQVSAIFEMLREAAIVERLEVTFEVRPELATKEIIGQFVRLTGNEIRRRTAELGAVEFESLVDRLPSQSSEQLLVGLPASLKRMLDCDEVTCFMPATHSDGTTVLFPWHSTSDVWLSEEPFYRIVRSDGLTGYAATRKDVLAIANITDAAELSAIDPDLTWKKKVGEGTAPDARSFFAMPIHRGNGLVGLIRGHRGMVGNRFAFSLEEVSRLRRVQFLLECAFAPEDTQFGPALIMTPSA